MSSPLNASTYEMNVNMVEHQRSILAALGIDVWVPKVDAQTRTYASSLYRDQVAPEQTTLQGDTLNLISNNNTNDAQKISAALHKIVQFPDSDQQIFKDLNVRQNLEKLTGQKLLEREAKEQQIQGQQEQDRQKLVTQNIIEQPETTYLAPFELHALSLERCVILVDATAMSEEQTSIWNNIQLAKSGQFSVLKWPFALAPLQDGRGAQVYVQGFIDALKMEKQVLSLGQIAYSAFDEIIELPSLQDMLDQPELKRKLWKFMQN